MPSDWVALAVTGLLSGGLASAVASIITARASTRKIKLEEQANPAHIQSIMVGGAEKAVASLVVVVEWQEREIKELREESAAKDARIADLEANLTRLQSQLRSLQAQVTRVQQEVRDSDPT